MKHYALRWIMVALLTCSQREHGASGSAETSDIADQPGPNVSLTAAPDVAFDYRYRFGLRDA